VNLPIGANPETRPGKGYLWRVIAVEDSGGALVLEYVEAHPENEVSS
jgi:hypothetical protein